MKLLILYFLLIGNLGTINAQSIVAHRGASADAPENSLESFKLAWEQGADFIEGDFFLTKDNKIICFHNKTTGQFTGQNLTIEKSNSKVLNNLKLYFKKLNKTATMPLIDEVLATIPKGKGIFIEIKSENIEILKFLKKKIDESKLRADQIQIISFKEKILRASKIIIPEIKTQWLLSFKKCKKGKINYTTNEIIKKLKDLKADGVGSNYFHEVVTKSNISTLKKQGFYWNIWTVNDPKKAKFLKKIGIDFITTDKPAYIKQNIE